MNTNILEVATLAAIVAVTWFLVSMNSPEIGGTNITNDVLNEVYENKSAEKYNLKSKGEAVDVDLIATCTNCSKDVTYLWQHEGSFEEEIYDSTAVVQFRAPDDEYYKFYSDKELNELASNDRETLISLKMKSPHTGNWLPHEKGRQWEKMTTTVAMDDNTKKDTKVSLGPGYHAFTCKISEGDVTLNENEDGELDIYWVYVEAAKEEKSTYSITLSSQETKAKNNNKKKSSIKTTKKVVSDDEKALDTSLPVTD